jgi:hypothetical protein
VRKALIAALILLAFVAYFVLHDTTTAQRQAIAVLQLPSEPRGPNGWALTWSSDYDVPYRELPGLYHEDVRSMPAWLAETPMPKDKDGPWATFPRTAAKRFLPLPTISDAERDVLCGITVPNCLEFARTHADAMAAALQRHARLLAVTEQLVHARALWSLQPPDVRLPLFQVSGLPLWRSAAALQFVTGHMRAGLVTACNGAQAMRQMHRNSNTLLGSLLLVAEYRRQARLAAWMMSEMTPGEALPDACMRAFDGPRDDDVNLCPWAANELLANGIHEPGVPTREAWGAPLRRNVMSGKLARLCSKEAHTAVMADLPFSLTGDSVAPPSALQRIAWPRSVALVDTLGEYDRYVDREAEYIVIIRLARVAAWLHMHPSAEPLATRLASLPPSLALPPTRHLSAVCDSTCIAMDEHWPLENGDGPWPVLPRGAPITAGDDTAKPGWPTPEWDISLSQWRAVRGPALLDVDPDPQASSADACVMRETTLVFGMYAEASYCFAGNPLRLRRIQLQPDPADCRVIQRAASALFPAAPGIALQSSASRSAVWTVDSQTVARYSAAVRPSRLNLNELAPDRDAMPVREAACTINLMPAIAAADRR